MKARRRKCNTNNARAPRKSLALVAAALAVRQAERLAKKGASELAAVVCTVKEAARRSRLPGRGGLGTAGHNHHGDLGLSVPQTTSRTSEDVHAAYAQRDRVAGVWTEHGGRGSSGSARHADDDPYCVCDSCMYNAAP